jgi:uncharacterized membrane protein YqaE (UPF0057 family)
VKYLFAVVFPPLAFLLCGKLIQCLLSLALCLTCLGWLPAAIWAIAVVNSYEAERRHRELLEALEDTRK